MLGKKEQIAVQVFGKRMCGINDKADVVLTATSYHFGHLHASRQMNAVNKFYLLPVAPSRIIIRCASLFQHLHGLAAFRRSSENQYHLVIFVQR